MHQRRDLYLAQINDLRGAAHDADRGDLAAALQAFAQAPDMHIGDAPNDVAPGLDGAA